VNSVGCGLTIVQEKLSIDGVELLNLCQPQSVTEVCEIVRQATADGQAVFPVGAGTMLDLGLPPTRPGIGIDLRSLDQVIDYPARDMTITVQAGITIAKLQAILAAENQRLPIDVPAAERATLGGAIATNTSGPRRYGCGTLRDYVIGISVVNDEGHEVKAGGRVVKNVAGYDLCKLYIGSLGTLGIITQVTLKVKPRPEEQAMAVLECSPESVRTVLDQLHTSQTRPVCIELINQAALIAINQRTSRLLPEKASWAIVVGFEENSQAVVWQIQQLVKERQSTGLGGLDVRFGSVADSLWQSLVEFQIQPESRLSFKANMVSSATADFCLAAANLGFTMQIQAHAGNGIVIGSIIDDLSLSQVDEVLQKLQAWAIAGQGNVIVWHCPVAWKSQLPIWRVPRGDAWLMRTVRQRLDPRQLFNPGRMG
jgi:glycolate oxidase FAD binding subunit